MLAVRDLRRGRPIRRDAEGCPDHFPVEAEHCPAPGGGQRPDHLQATAGLGAGISLPQHRGVGARVGDRADEMTGPRW
jgi:hypothetical protein